MSVLINKDTRLLLQGAGRAGQFQCTRHEALIRFAHSHSMVAGGLPDMS